MSDTVRGMVDPAGRLVGAEPALEALNARAGGTLGEAFAIPQVAVLARLAHRLGITVSRHVTAADGPDEIELWVRALPKADGVALEIAGWRLRPAWVPAESARRERDLLLGDADWSWETDASLSITAITPNAAQHGIVVASLLGQPIDALMTPEVDEHGGMPLYALLLGHGPFDDEPATIRMTGARVLLSARPRLDAGGTFAGYIGAARHAEVAPATPEPAVHRGTVHPDALTAAFSAQLDRALRGPLDRIIANADSINAQTDGPIRQDYADYAADIASAGRHLLGLVDDLVDLQAIERLDFAPAAEPIDLVDLGRRAAGLLAVRAAERGVRIDVPQDIDRAPATGEFRRVLQILLNLIGNAVRYSPEGGMVWVRTHRDRDSAVVIVADQGKGIAVGDQARIFDKFERVDPSEPGGSGLGLYIARRLARAMGGDLTVDSAPGQGARFVLRLPAQAG
ncbi:MAG: HAMP domain-containing histidine kinase [Sphingomonas sp.]|uniref:sensor histidine kinase n=1 Tax=Sphingomonas sp. TaxID=28214 RepID=UPI001ACD415C|nr:HAMP domain-containing sensor histidine kinase [Sphingomonas sp.]MBN8807215.1 HAMP domain-containing histidine kinase [Sphingomonas sp.]